MRKVITGCLFGWLSVINAMSATHYVTTNGPGSAPYTNWATAANNLQDAGNAATDNAVIMVSNGVYATGGSGARITITNAGLVLMAVSTNPADTVIVGAPDPDPGDPANPGIGADAVRCVYVNASDVTISGFTMSNGWSTSITRAGGGLYIIKNPLWVENCRIVNCVGAQYGAGAQHRQTPLAPEQVVFSRCIFERNSNWHDADASYGGAAGNVTLTNNCQVTSNTARIGGGTYNCLTYNSEIRGNHARDGGGCWGGIHHNTTIANNSTWNPVTAGQGVGGGGQRGDYYNCVIVSNYSYRGGCGLDLVSNSRVENCLIAYNYAGLSVAGAGAVLHDGTRTNICLVNCTVIGNSVPSSGAGGAFRRGIDVVNCIVWSNKVGEAVDNWETSESGFTFSHTLVDPLPVGGADLGGNQNADPMLADDLRLRSGSPCVNAGTNQLDWMTTAVDLDGRPRIDRFSGKADMGGYEYLPRGSLYNVR